MKSRFTTSCTTNYLVLFLIYLFPSTQIFFGNEKDGQKKVVIAATPPKPLLSPAAQKFVDSLPTPSSSVKMTAFHWTKIPHNQVDRSMWPDLLAKTSFKATIDSKALEELFGSREAIPTTTDSSSSNGAGYTCICCLLTSSYCVVFSRMLCITSFDSLPLELTLLFANSYQ
jgi:hypothetical protein